jgi:hypothetical protein
VVVERARDPKAIESRLRQLLGVPEGAPLIIDLGAPVVDAEIAPDPALPERSSTDAGD